MSGDPFDHSVYPDREEPPSVLDTAEAKADYVYRVCTAWDYGVHPGRETFALFERWKDVFDRFLISTSPGYHAFRAWFGWDRVARPENVFGPTPRYRLLDRLEGVTPRNGRNCSPSRGAETELALKTGLASSPAERAWSKTNLFGRSSLRNYPKTIAPLWFSRAYEGLEGVFG